MNRRFTPIARLGLGLAVCGLGLTLGLGAAADSADDASARRLDKQIRIFESALDEMLIESPNLLVRERDATHGLSLEGEGAIFTFRIGLNIASWDSDGPWWGRIRVEDRNVIILSGDDIRTVDYDTWRDEEIPRQEKLYEGGKKEIEGTILDFGEVLSLLGDDEWIVIRARLRNCEYFEDADLHKLEVKMQMRDVRAYAAGRLSREEAMRKIQVEES